MCTKFYQYKRRMEANTKINIRFAHKRDLPNIVDIYNQAIRSHTATGDMDEFMPSERIEWFNQYTSNDYPLYVALIKEKIVGYCCISPYRAGRRAMKKTAEISFYIDYKYHGKGVASALIEHALEDAKRIDKESYLAILLDINKPSIALLEKFGFKRWGYFPNIIDFDGVKSGHLVYGRSV